MDIRIDNGDARVLVRQVFTNHTGSSQKGNYQFALPGGTRVSDFAVWNGPVRIPAVILERKRAEALYQELKSQTIDPGLQQQGERTEDDARRNSIFSAYIVPIPAYGTKRLEIEYHQTIPWEMRKSYFVLPLKPHASASQKVARLTIHFELHSAAPLKDSQCRGSCCHSNVRSKRWSAINCEDFGLAREFRRCSNRSNATVKRKPPWMKSFDWREIQIRHTVYVLPGCAAAAASRRDSPWQSRSACIPTPQSRCFLPVVVAVVPRETIPSYGVRYFSELFAIAAPPLLLPAPRPVPLAAMHFSH